MKLPSPYQKNISIFCLFLTLSLLILSCDTKKEQNSNLPPFMLQNSDGIDEAVLKMTVNEKIEQLILAYYDSTNSKTIDDWQQQVIANNISAVIYKTDSIDKQRSLWQNINNKKSPQLLNGISTNNGSISFINDIISPQNNLINKSIDNDSLISEYAQKITLQCKLFDIQFNILPIFQNFNNVREKDTLLLFDNEQFRSSVLQKANLYTKILQQNKILAGISTFSLYPQINNRQFETNNLKSFPKGASKAYKNIIDSSISIISISDTVDFRTLKYLSDSLKFRGLIIANPIDSSGNYELAIKNTLNSGADILKLTSKIDETAKIIRKLIDNDELSMKQLDKKVKKIMLAKLWTENSSEIFTTKQIKDTLNHIDNTLLKRKIFEASLTLVKNQDSLIPFGSLKNKKFYTITIGKNDLPEFREQLKYYSLMNSRFVDTNHKNFVRLITASRGYNNLIIALNDLSNDTIDYSSIVSEITKLNAKQNVIVLNFGDPKMLAKLKGLKTIIQVYGNSVTEQEYAAQLLFGGIAAQGVLPYNISDSLLARQGIKTKTVRLKYTIAEDAGINANKLAKIDSIAMNAVRAHATPGCQVFVAKDGKVIYNKSFGYLTYGIRRPVRWNSLYDVASVSKVAGTTIAAMKMYDQKKLSLNTTLKECFKDTKIEYTRIKPDTITKIDTLHLNKIRNIKKFVKEWDTIHISDSVIVAFDTLIYRLNPKLNIFKTKIKDLLKHQSGISPSLPILPLYLYKMNYEKNGFRITPERYLYVIDSLKNTGYKQADTIVKMKIITDTIHIRKDSLFASIDSFEIDNYNDNIIIKTDTVYYGFDRYFCRNESDKTGYQIANKFYMRKEYCDTLWMDIKQMRVFGGHSYHYTDVNMILLQQAIDSINGLSINKYLDEYYFKSLGLQTTCYQPLKRFKSYRIAPTERDHIWRNQVLRGHVHDPSAAFLGGLSGNAGLFSNAHDLGIMFQMLLNKGSYGGTQYIQPSTVELFTRKNEDNSRGLGFDMVGSGFTSECGLGNSASSETYGHTGFTGTCVWVDPKHNLVYVFLSNRVHPSAKNWKINSLKVRQNIHQAIYDAIISEQ